MTRHPPRIRAVRRSCCAGPRHLRSTFWSPCWGISELAAVRVLRALLLGGGHAVFGADHPGELLEPRNDGVTVQQLAIHVIP